MELTGSLAEEEMFLADGAVLADREMLFGGETSVARAAMLEVPMDAVAIEKRRAAISARRFCLRDMLFSLLICS